MRAVFIGAANLSVMTARILLERDHEVVIIERNSERISALREELDVGIIHGDGSKPVILREADPENTHYLFCMTSDDQTNILAALVGRSLGYEHIVTKIEDPSLEHICIELGLEETIIPARNIGRYLADTFQGMNLLDLASLIRDEARMFTFIAEEEEAGPVQGLELPEKVRVVCLYRDDAFIPVDDETEIEEEDQVVLIAHSDQMESLRERWGGSLNGAKK